MRIFRQQNSKNKQSSTSGQPAEGSKDENGLDAMEAAASMLRILGNHAFELEGNDHNTFTDNCERWARHLATGSQPPLENADHQDVGDTNKPMFGPGGANSPRNWTDAIQFFRTRRVREQAFVNRRLREQTSLIWDLADTLKAAQKGNATSEKTIDTELNQFGQVVEGGALAQIQTQFSRLADNVRHTLEEQREDFKKQVQTLKSRLQEAERDRDMSRSEVQLMNRQLTAMREDLQVIRRQLELDPLTQVYNRGAFDQTIRRYIDLALVSGQTLALMMLDVDHFKAINDRYGHLAGDQVLIALGKTLTRAFLRKDDFLARYGGEEFTILLFVSEISDMEKVSQNVLNKVADMEIQRVPEATITCSIGYTFLNSSDTPDSLIRRADEALYRAKANGRNRFEVG
ncbi:MAG: diguanylate cyclase [Pseudomonadota bacterium]|nr:diguanylate cyclase [Pseudomonadota bacterium]